jgi:hypothetical protein
MTPHASALSTRIVSEHWEFVLSYTVILQNDIKLEVDSGCRQPIDSPYPREIR